jgi:U3 small nucleolar RNA-associated protein 19
MATRARKSHRVESTQAVKAALIADEHLVSPNDVTASPAATSGLTGALASCDGATTFADLERLFQRHVNPVLHALVRLPLTSPVTDAVAPTDCCDEAVLVARKIAMKYDDFRLLLCRFAAYTLRGLTPSATAAAGEGLKRKLLRAKEKRQRPSGGEDTGNEAVTGSSALATNDDEAAIITNIYCLLYGVTFAATEKGDAVHEASLRWPALVAEKRALETSEAYSNANAAERRAMQLKRVLVLFSDRGRRHEFSAVWSAFVDLAVPAPLRLHFLTAVGTHILPHLTRPVLLSDFLAKCFSQGGLTAVLALEGLFVLMLEHDLEYPSFYDKLYSLITPDAFSSRHRNQLFRLVSLSLTSLRVPAYVVAGFIKRICRVLLLAPSPTYYFALPFVRQLFQRHPNCLPLIHRTDGSPDLFDGKDPFDPFEDKLDQCHAIDSTLWELCVLERHFLPAVNLMVSAYSSPAHDNAPLKFDKTYGRLFAQDITRSKADDPGVISYKAPAGGLLQAGHKEAGLAGVFVF